MLRIVALLLILAACVETQSNVELAEVDVSVPHDLSEEAPILPDETQYKADHSPLDEVVTVEEAFAEEGSDLPLCMEKPELCDDNNPCTRDTCDPVMGCIHEPLSDSDCDDGDECTIGDKCTDGTCVPGTRLFCDDENPCTDDSCGDSGCVHEPNTAKCDDGNPCTENDRCADGVCIGDVASHCVCENTADCIAFQPSNLCLGKLVCVNNVCVIDPDTVVKCDTSKDTACKKTSCDPSTGLCVQNAVSDNTPCDDFNVCTVGDRCIGGTCVAGVPLNCSDNNVCTTDTCDPVTGCQHTNNSNLCAPAQCMGNLLLPAAYCMNGTCPKQVAVPCSDNNACTTDDYCLDGVCRPGTGFLDCNDYNVCTDDWCSPAAGCVNTPNTSMCAVARCVGKIHYSASFCANKSCPPQAVTDCSSNIPCMVDTCDPATGCSHTIEEKKCLIDGACLDEGYKNPINPCMECRPGSSQTAWTTVPDGTSCGAGMACVQGVCRGPIITEFMAVNHDTMEDEDGDSSDWIEIYNPTPATISLKGYHLTDDSKKPEKWTFPDVMIAPESYLVVFASGKNRTDPARELHTNFKLDGDGEYLALTAPDLTVIQAFNKFPPQGADVSYGLAVYIENHLLVPTGALARYRPPSSSNPPSNWTDIEFDDSAWIPAITGIGFDISQGYEVPAVGEELGVPLADSVADWSVTGGQGVNGWIYGYYNRTADPDHQYSVDDFVPFPRSGSGYGPDDYWNGAMYDWYQGDPPFTAIGQEYMHPSSTGAEHWVIKRYQAEAEGPLYIEWSLAKADAKGDGVTGYVFLRGVLVDSVTIAGTDTQGTVRSLVLEEVSPNDPIDFALGPAGPQGQQDTGDGSFLRAGIWQLPRLKDHVATDVGEAMAGLYPGLFIRIPFDKNITGPFNRLWLRMKFDDGFVAYLNGEKIASANAPEPCEWDSTATTNRSVAAALSLKRYDARQYAALITSGKGVLAIQGLNASVDDPTFLILPELEAQLVTYDPTITRYYSKPTPGTDNEEGSSGPVIEHLTPGGSVEPGQPIVVSARVYISGAQVASAVTYYRVMFGPEVPVVMTPGPSGVYQAVIPADVASPGQMVRWYIVVTDTLGRGARAPLFRDPLDSEQYFGTIINDPSVVSNLPVLHWFVENFAAAGTWTGTRCSLFFNGEFYDNIRFDLHGQSTAGFPKKSYDVDFNSDHRFRLSPEYRRMKDINLLTNYADKSKIRNTLAYESLKEAGTGYHLAFPVRIQKNGAFFSVADFVEDADDRWLERIGLDPKGALYKQYDGLYDASKGEKKTRKEEDRSDLMAFIAGLDKTEDDLRNFIYDNVRIPAMVSFLAGLTLIADMDCCHKNFYIYRDTNYTGEWWFMPWDVDLSFGRNWIKTLAYFDDTMHPDNPLFVGGNNKLISRLYAMPEFREMYVRRVRTLMDNIQQPPWTPQSELRYEKRIDELVAQIGEDGALDYAAWPKWGQDQTMEQAATIMKQEYMAPRRVFLFETKTADGTIPEAQDNPVVIFGAFDPSPGNPAQAYFTVTNPNPFSVDISGWRVTGEVQFTFPPGTVLVASGTIYVSPNVVAFRARPMPPTGGQGLLVLGDYKGTLTDVATLVLLNELGAVVPQF